MGYYPLVNGYSLLLKMAIESSLIYPCEMVIFQRVSSTDDLQPMGVQTNMWIYIEMF